MTLGSRSTRRLTFTAPAYSNLGLTMRPMKKNQRREGPWLPSRDFLPINSTQTGATHPEERPPIDWEITLEGKTKQTTLQDIPTSINWYAMTAMDSTSSM